MAALWLGGGKKGGKLAVSAICPGLLYPGQDLVFQGVSDERQAVSDPAFDTKAEAELSDLADRLEAASAQLEVDFDAGNLTVDLPDGGGQYLLNKHYIHRQIWLSSPRSGAHHFGLDGEAWRSTRGPHTLRALLAEELSAALGEKIAL
jgi:frataxin